MRLSIIIPAHNEERLIAGTVRAALEACRPNLHEHEYEVIVVDDASEDRTGALAAEAGARVIRVEHRQISRTRNAGIPHARGRILLWVDADTRVPANAIRDVLAVIARRGIGGGAPVTLDGPVPLYGRIMLSILVPLFRFARATGGCFLFCTREAVDALSPDGRLWDESLFAGEEIMLCRRLHRHAGRRRFHIIRTPVVTSGRKLRTHSAREVLGPMASILLRGRRALESREHLGLWYAPRRPE